MKTNIFIIATVSIILGTMSCKKMDSNYEDYLVPNGIVYPGKATTPVVHSGYRRVQLTWQRGADPLVVKAKVYWNNYTDSIEFNVPANQQEISIVIPDLPENFYTFIIKTYDNKGNVSVPVEISGNVYGEKYRTTLLPRPIVSSTLNLANNLTIVLDSVPVATPFVSSEIEYTNTLGETKIIIVPNATRTIQIPDYKKETSYKFRTKHLPDPVAYDTLITTNQVIDKFLLNKTEWKVVAFSSTNPDANNVSIAPNMIDGNPATRWLTHASTSVYPHYVTVDLGILRTIKTVSLWRWVQTVADERGPDTVQFLSSTDNSANASDWINLGTFNFNRFVNNEQIFSIANQVAGRYLKVVALTGPQKFVILGEVSVTVK